MCWGVPPLSKPGPFVRNLPAAVAFISTLSQDSVKKHKTVSSLLLNLKSGRVIDFMGEREEKLRN